MAAKQDTSALFEERSRGSVTAITAVFVVLSFALVFGGMVLSSYSFGHEMAWEIFSAGLAMTVVGLILPLWVLPALDK